MDAPRIARIARFWGSPIAIAVGTEDEGLSGFWMSNADVKVRIPMMGKVNSLNVSIATALITYEALRQRSEK